MALLQLCKKPGNNIYGNLSLRGAALLRRSNLQNVIRLPRQLLKSLLAMTLIVGYFFLKVRTIGVYISNIFKKPAAKAASFVF